MHDFIKLDVEGFEFEVLKGAITTLSRQLRPIWLVEIQPTRDYAGRPNERFVETFEVFWRHGYQCRMADTSGRQVSPDDVRVCCKSNPASGLGLNYVFE